MADHIFAFSLIGGASQIAFLNTSTMGVLKICVKDKVFMQVLRTPGQPDTLSA